MASPPKKRGPGRSPKKLEDPFPPTPGLASAKPQSVGLITLVLRLDERLDKIDRKLAQIMATNADLQAEVQRLQQANTAQTALIQAEHDEVMAAIDALAGQVGIDQATFDLLKAEIDKVGTNSEAVKAIYTPPAP